MCGQLGYSSSNSNFDLDKIKLLAVWNSLERGVDATGLYSPKNGLKTTLLRGSEYVMSNDFNIVPDKILMAHFRAATIGNKNDIKNVHPFVRNNYVLQHNGTLTNHNDLLKKYDLEYYKYSVDSDIICGAIAKSNNIPIVLSEINGPAAIIIHDKNVENTLYVYRNADRPLYKGYYNGSMYISSIENSLKLINCLNIKLFDENVLYTIKDGLIKHKEKIVSKPYKQPAPLNNFTSNTVIYESYLALGSWIKSLYDITYKNQNNLFLKKNNYYYVEKTINKDSIVVYCPKQKKQINTSISVFDKSDIILERDFCKVSEDCYSRTNSLVAKKDTIVEITVSYGDGEAGVRNIKTLGYLGIVKKENLIKIKDKDLFALIDEENQDEQSVQNEEEIEYDLSVNSELLSEMFTEYNNRLLDLKKSIKNNDVPILLETKLNEIIDFNLSNFCDYIDADDANNVEPEKNKTK